MEIPYAGQITKQDFIRAQLLHNRLSRRAKWRLGVTVAFMVLLLVGSVGVLLENPVEPYFIIVPIFLLFAATLPLWYMRLVAPRAWNAYASKALREPQSGTFTEQGYHFVTAVSEGDMAWSGFIKYRRVDDIVLLYQSPRMINIFPKALFKSEADWQAFTELVASKLPEASQVKDKRALVIRWLLPPSMV